MELCRMSAAIEQPSRQSGENENVTLVNSSFFVLRISMLLIAAASHPRILTSFSRLNNDSGTVHEKAPITSQYQSHAQCGRVRSLKTKIAAVFRTRTGSERVLTFSLNFIVSDRKT